MKDRFEADFVFQNKPYVANVYVKSNEEGVSYIVNLFDKQLNKEFPRSYTFIGKDHTFNPAKAVTADELELINAIKQAIIKHRENQYLFKDGDK